MKVMLVEKKDTKKIYALKSLRKEELIDKDQVQHTKTERYVLEKVLYWSLVK
jgi:serum/glucocorticoid-regulated kinase 2